MNSPSSDEYYDEEMEYENLNTKCINDMSIGIAMANDLNLITYINAKINTNKNLPKDYILKIAKQWINVYLCEYKYGISREMLDEFDELNIFTEEYKQKILNYVKFKGLVVQKDDRKKL